jgi:hypothetical protein
VKDAEALNDARALGHPFSHTHMLGLLLRGPNPSACQEAIALWNEYEFLMLTIGAGSLLSPINFGMRGLGRAACAASAEAAGAVSAMMT